MQTYELARTSDPQLAAAESSRSSREGAVQARAAMLPQINGDASYNRSRNDSESSSGHRHAAPTPPHALGLRLNQIGVRFRPLRPPCARQPSTP
jgi:outer membrane protein TolC